MIRAAGGMRVLAFCAAMCAALPAAALTPAAAEFIALVKKLEPVLCQKTKLRHEILVAQTEQDTQHAAQLRARYAALERDPQTARLEKRLAELQELITDEQGRIRDSSDLEAISAQQREAYARCQY